MIINAADGNTTRAFKRFTDRGALAHFLDCMEIGSCASIDKFIRIDGYGEPLKKVQIRIATARAPGSVYRTSIQNGSLVVRRLA